MRTSSSSFSSSATSSSPSSSVTHEALPVPANSVGGGGAVGAVGSGCNTWQMMSSDDHEVGNGGALVGDQDCFAWSGLAISHIALLD
ncbi:hypothetical protein ACOSQ2_031767 [Xanthoceras sorbifolium]